LPEPAVALDGVVPLPPEVIERPQGCHVGAVLAALEQGGDALRVDVQRSCVLPKPSAPRVVGQLELGHGQLPHQQKHQWLFRAKVGSAVSVGVVDPAPMDAVPALAPAGSEQRWAQLGRLRRAGVVPDGWIHALAVGAMSPDADLLAALWARLGRADVDLLLSSGAAADPQPWLAAGLIELPVQALRSEVREAWLEPLLHRASMASGLAGSPWLRLAGHFRHPAVAEQLRLQLQRGLAQGADLDVLAPLLPLLGLQRDPRDASLLQEWALAPYPDVVRRAALEGLSVGHAAWPAETLVPDLAVLAEDLNPSLASSAVDLLVRMPVGQPLLRSLLAQPLDPGVRGRVQRHLRLSPLVLLVHGRQGGVIPQALRELAAELEECRGVPVLLQALTAPPPEVGPAFQWAAQRAGGATLVPLLLLPGSHVRVDLPAIAADWRASGPLRLRPFLGAWPAWHQALAEELETVGGEPEPLLMHHPLEGVMAGRYLRLLEQRCRCRCVAAPYSAADSADTLLPASLAGSGAALPLALAANRLCERLQVPPLLERPGLRKVLLHQLELLP
jgi:hypothetical protein